MNKAQWQIVYWLEFFGGIFYNLFRVVVEHVNSNLNICFFVQDQFLNKLGTLQIIQDCSNEGFYLSPRCCSRKTIPKHWKLLYKSTRLIVTNLGTLQIIQDCSNEGQYLSQRPRGHVIGKQYEYIDNFYINPQGHFNQTSWMYEIRKIPMKVKPFFKVYSSTFNPEHVLSKVIWFIATKVGATHS